MIGARHAHADPPIASVQAYRFTFSEGPFGCSVGMQLSILIYMSNSHSAMHVWAFCLPLGQWQPAQVHGCIPVSLLPNVITIIASAPPLTPPPLDCPCFGCIQYISVTISNRILNSPLTFFYTCSTSFDTPLELWGIFFLARIHPNFLLTLLTNSALHSPGPWQPFVLLYILVPDAALSLFCGK